MNNNINVFINTITNKINISTDDIKVSFLSYSNINDYFLSTLSVSVNYVKIINSKFGIIKPMYTNLNHSND